MIGSVVDGKDRRGIDLKLGIVLGLGILDDLEGRIGTSDLEEKTIDDRSVAEKINLDRNVVGIKEEKNGLENPKGVQNFDLDAKVNTNRKEAGKLILVETEQLVNYVLISSRLTYIFSNNYFKNIKKRRV